MGSSTSTAGGGGRSRRTPVQTYEQFKTPEGAAAAVERQKAILAGTKTKTGAFANIESKLPKGFTLSADKSSVLKNGKTVAGVTGTGSLFSGSKEISDIIKSSQPRTVDQTRSMSDVERQTTRIATSLETMGRLEQLDEPSKAREAEIQKALNYGRGVQPAPTVLDPTRIVASTPTLRELGGDIARAVVGGTAPSVPYLKVGYQPERVKGILDIDTITNTLKNLPTPGSLLLKGISSLTGGKDDSKESQPVYQGTTEFVDQYKESEAIAREKKRLAAQAASQAARKRSLFQLGSNLTFGGK